MRKTLLCVVMLGSAIVAFAGTVSATGDSSSPSDLPVDPSDLPVCATGYVGPCCEEWENPVDCTWRVGWEITYGASYFAYAACTAALSEPTCYDLICNTWWCQRLDPCESQTLVQARIETAP